MRRSPLPALALVLAAWAAWPGSAGALPLAMELDAHVGAAVLPESPTPHAVAVVREDGDQQLMLELSAAGLAQGASITAWLFNVAEAAGELTFAQQTGPTSTIGVASGFDVRIAFGERGLLPGERASFVVSRSGEGTLAPTDFRKTGSGGYGAYYSAADVVIDADTDAKAGKVAATEAIVVPEPPALALLALGLLAALLWLRRSAV